MRDRHRSRPDRIQEDSGQHLVIGKLFGHWHRVDQLMEALPCVPDDDVSESFVVGVSGPRDRAGSVLEIEETSTVLAQERSEDGLSPPLHRRYGGAFWLLEVGREHRLQRPVKRQNGGWCAVGREWVGRLTIHLQVRDRTALGPRS